MTAEPTGNEKLTRAAGSVSLATLISRIFGFARDVIIADLFGAKAVADAFFVAFRIPNLLRRFTAEGALTAAFVPVYTDKLKNQGKHAAFALACNVLTIMALLLVVVTVAGMAFAPWVIRVIAPGFVLDRQTFELTALLTRVMFPYLFFISIAAVLMAMLNSMGRFFIPAIAPALLNIAIITCALSLHDIFDRPAMALAIGVLAGGVLQLSLQVWPLYKLGWRYIPRLDFGDVATLKVGALMIPAAFGMAVAEINVFVDTLLASILPEGSVSYLYYGNRVVQFPLGVFGVAVGIAALPSMSGEVAEGGPGKLVGLVSHALRLTLFISIPSTVGLIALAGPINNVLFERGQFDETARVGATIALVMYAVGLAAFAGVKVVVSAFYALKDTATPTKVASYCMALNIALNLILMEPMKHGGLALATSISSMVNIGFLLWLLGRRIGSVDATGIVRAVRPMVISSLLMGAVVYGYAHLFFSYESPAWIRALSLCVAISGGATLYFAGALLMGSGEAGSVWRRLKHAGSPR